jgi:hypothetical protein
MVVICPNEPDISSLTAQLGPQFQVPLNDLLCNAISTSWRLAIGTIFDRDVLPSAATGALSQLAEKPKKDQLVIPYTCPYEYVSLFLGWLLVG